MLEKELQFMLKLSATKTNKKEFPMNSLHINDLNFNSRIKINFEGGNLSSDSGLLAYRSFAETIGLIPLVESAFSNNTNKSNLNKYKFSDIVLQNIFKTIGGYHTDASSNDLRHDCIFKTILNDKDVASQPTISRHINKTNIESYKKLSNVNLSMLFNAYKIKKPEHFIFDLDSTAVQTYGNQCGSSYNYHYTNRSFHPLLLFDGLTGDLIHAELRSGKVYTSRNVVRFIGPVLKKYNKHFKDTYKIIRADSGFACPNLYRLAEDMNAFYVIRLKLNRTLENSIKEHLENFNTLYSQDFSKHVAEYGEFEYKAKSWEKSRRVCYKIRRKAGELFPELMFVVTTMLAEPEKVIKFYAKRGEMENFIKEAKRDFGFDTLSHHNYMANANRMIIQLIAYNLHNLMRRLCMDKLDQCKHMHSLRVKFVKVAGKIIHSARYTTYKLCSSYPYKKSFVNLFQNINRLQCGT